MLNSSWAEIPLRWDWDVPWMWLWHRLEPFVMTLLLDGEIDWRSLPNDYAITPWHHEFSIRICIDYICRSNKVLVCRYTSQFRSRLSWGVINPSRYDRQSCSIAGIFQEIDSFSLIIRGTFYKEPAFHEYALLTWASCFLACQCVVALHYEVIMWNMNAATIISCWYIASRLRRGKRARKAPNLGWFSFSCNFCHLHWGFFRLGAWGKLACIGTFLWSRVYPHAILRFKCTSSFFFWRMSC